jgi:putative oxidoreductase
MSTNTYAEDRESVDRRALHSTDWALLIIRLALATVFIAHGGQKVFGWFGGKGLDATVAGFGKMGIPAPLAYVAAFTEFCGGVAMLVGLLSRIAGIGLSITMIVAVAMVHWKNGFFLDGPTGPGFEYNLALFALSLAIVIAGPGRIALADIEGRLFAHADDGEKEDKMRGHYPGMLKGASP